MLQTYLTFTMRVHAEAILFAFKVHQNVGGFDDACFAQFSDVSENIRELTKEQAEEEPTEERANEN